MATYEVQLVAEEIELARRDREKRQREYEGDGPVSLSTPGYLTIRASRLEVSNGSLVFYDDDGIQTVLSAAAFVQVKRVRS